jgi:hypothetical protein
MRGFSQIWLFEKKLKLKIKFEHPFIYVDSYQLFGNRLLYIYNFGSQFFEKVK